MKLSNALWFALFSVAAVAGLHLVPPMVGMSIDPAVLTGARWWAVGALCFYGWQNQSLNTWILLSMVIGFEVGLDLGKSAKDLDVLSSIFIRMIKTVVGPLLFSTLVIAIAGQENANLESKGVMGGGKTMGAYYIDHVNDMGNIARQAAISQSALQVVYDQSVAARDEVSGVSLDQEAADLIRFQQAYQAAAKILQVASQLFDSVLAVR